MNAINIRFASIIVCILTLFLTCEAAGQTHALGDTSPTSLLTGGTANCQRGWRFTANVGNMTVTQLGCYYPDSNSNPKTLTLFDATTHAVLAQVTSTPGAGWLWTNLASPVTLTSGQQYAVVGHTVTSSYYYDSSLSAPSPWLPTGDVQYQQMVYCNSCSASTWPTSTLSNSQYGVVDIGYVTNCGNGTIDSGETCDEGTANGTTDCGCQTNCHVSPSGAACGDTTDNDCNGADTCDGAGVCEDNVVATGMPCGDTTDTECDGANTCDAAGVCQDNLQPSGAPCDDQGLDCIADDTCDGAGTCVDNGTLPDGAPCTSDDLFCNGEEECLSEVCVSPGDPCTSFGESCDELSDSCNPECGNGDLDTNEECDDGNLDNDDGCSEDCALEEGWTCEQEDGVGPDICDEICGDGLVVGDEECDDGNETDDDGCTDCEVDDGWSCDDDEPSDCELGDEDSGDDSLTTDSCLCLTTGAVGSNGMLETIFSLLSPPSGRRTTTTPLK